MIDFSTKELKWIANANKLFKKIPKTLRLYVCDSDIVICKLGQSVNDVSSSILGSNINCCTAITDVHDDMGFGNPF